MMERDRSQALWRPSSYCASLLGERLEPSLGQRISRKTRFIFFDLTIFLGIFILLHAWFWPESMDVLGSASPATPSIPTTSIFREAASWQRRYTDAELSLFDPHGAWDPSDIQRVCRDVRQIPGLYFGCSTGEAHYGDIRQSLLLCMRYALQMGGGLIMPRIKYFSELGLLSTYFDMDLFRSRLQEACPEMRLVDKRGDIPNVEQLESFRGSVDPYKFPGQRMAPGLKEHMVGNLFSMQANLEVWLKDNIKQQPTVRTPVFVPFYTVMWGWPIDFDTYDFWANWGKLLVPARDYKVLAAYLYDSLKRKTPLTTVLPSENNTTPEYASILITQDDSQLEQMEDILAAPELQKLDTRVLYLPLYDHDREVALQHMREAVDYAAKQGLSIETRMTLLSLPDESSEHTTASGVKVKSGVSGAGGDTAADKQVADVFNSLRHDQAQIVDWLLSLRSRLLVASLAPPEPRHTFARYAAVSRHIWAVPPQVARLTASAKLDLARTLIYNNATLAQHLTAQRSGKPAVGEYAITLETGLKEEEESRAHDIVAEEMKPYWRTSEQRDGRTVLMHDTRNEFLYSQIWP